MSTDKAGFVKRLLALLNPLIWVWNIFNYMAHLEGQRNSSKYKPYDFTQDIPYFRNKKIN